jgi:hypothetical protein
MLLRYLLLASLMTAIAGYAAPLHAQEAEDGGERQAVPRGSRPQGDNPRVGTAVPRGERPAPQAAPPRAAEPARREAGPINNPRTRIDNRNRTVIVQPPSVYNNYYSYPRRAYPYGYGAFGLGYFYYDPYRWHSAYGAPGYYPPPYGYASGYGYRSVFDIGELRLQVSPRDAQVFVDGYYAGTVDDYDGAFQALKLESGPYSIRIAAPGYEDLQFDVRISPGQKVNYRGELRRF